MIVQQHYYAVTVGFAGTRRKGENGASQLTTKNVTLSFYSVCTFLPNFGLLPSGVCAHRPKLPQSFHFLNLLQVTSKPQPLNESTRKLWLLVKMPRVIVQQNDESESLGGFAFLLRANRLIRIDFSEEVVVLVGVTEQRFFAHRDVLCDGSDFFKAACMGEWREVKDKTIRLSEQQPVAFRIYINWRYTASIDLWNGKYEQTTYKGSDGNTYPQSGPRYERLLSCYVLGDMLRDEKLCNALINSYFELREMTKSTPQGSLVNQAFKRLPESSNLRLLMVHHLAFSAHINALKANTNILAAEVGKQIAL